MEPERSKTIAMTFLRQEILDDIRQYAFVAGDVMAEENLHARHQVMDILEDGNIEIVTRVMSLALAQCREFLYPYSKLEVVDRSEFDDYYDEPCEYVMELKVEEDFSETSADYLVKLIHKFVVYMILIEWYTIANPEAVPGITALAQSAEEKIKAAGNRRLRRVRRPLTPF